MKRSATKSTTSRLRRVGGVIGLEAKNRREPFYGSLEGLGMSPELGRVSKKRSHEETITVTVVQES
eukprot:6069506-Amphidinium_carterae.1